MEGFECEGPWNLRPRGHLVFVVHVSNSSPQHGRESDILQPKGNCPHHRKTSSYKPNIQRIFQGGGGGNERYQVKQDKEGTQPADAHALAHAPNAELWFWDAGSVALIEVELDPCCSNWAPALLLEATSGRTGFNPECKTTPLESMLIQGFTMSAISVTVIPPLLEWLLLPPSLLLLRPELCLQLLLMMI